MNNAELIAALRVEPFEVGSFGLARIINQAADLTEAQAKRIEELEKQDSVEMHKKQVARIAELEAQMARGKDSMRCKFAVDHGGGLVECMGYRKVCCGKQRYDTNDDGSINIVECIDVKGEQE